LLVEQKSPKAIANAIDKIFSDSSLRDKIIENSKETLKEFLPSHIAQEYLKIFNKIIHITK